MASNTCQPGPISRRCPSWTKCRSTCLAPRPSCARSASPLSTPAASSWWSSPVGPGFQTQLFHTNYTTDHTKHDRTVHTERTEIVLTGLGFRAALTVLTAMAFMLPGLLYHEHTEHTELTELFDIKHTTEHTDRVGGIIPGLTFRRVPRVVGRRAARARQRARRQRRAAAQGGVTGVSGAG